MAKLTAKARKAIPSKDFAGPDRSYPIENISHARNALARASGKPVQARVDAAVHRKYPSIGGKVKKYDQHPAPEAPKHISPPKAAVPAGGMSHSDFEGLTHGKHDHMIGRTLKPFEKTGK